MNTPNIEYLKSFTDHRFEQLPIFEDGRTPLYLTEEQYNTIRGLVAKACSSPDPQPAAYLHQVVCGNGEPDQALSFEADSFPLSEALGFRSIAHEPLFKQAPAAQDVAGLVNALTDARQVLATALQASAPDWFKTEADIAGHHTIKKIDGALAAHGAQQGEQP